MEFQAKGIAHTRTKNLACNESLCLIHGLSFRFKRHFPGASYGNPCGNLNMIFKFHLSNGHTLSPGSRVFISTNPLWRSQALAFVGCPKVQTKRRCGTLETGLYSSILPTLQMSWILFLVSKAPARILAKEG